MKVNGAENGPMLVRGAFLNSSDSGTRAMAAAPLLFPWRGGSALAAAAVNALAAGTSK